MMWQSRKQPYWILVLASLVMLLQSNAVAITNDTLQQAQLENAALHDISSEVKINYGTNIPYRRGIAPLEMFFDASSSLGGNLQYFWDFGDGTTATGAKVTHIYSSVGDYQLKLVVKNDIDTKSLSLVVNVVENLEFAIDSVPFFIDKNEIATADSVSASYGTTFLEAGTYEGSVLAKRSNISLGQEIDYATLHNLHGNIIAEDVIFPGTPREFIFNAKNSIRAGVLYLLLPLPRGSNNIQFSQEELVQIYHLVDTVPNFEQVANKLSEGAWFLEDKQFNDIIAQMAYEGVYPLLLAILEQKKRR